MAAVELLRNALLATDGTDMSFPSVKILAVVPARGGSKGISGKNLRTIQGQTLVARAVEAAQNSTLVTRVVGSTDDAAIAEEFRRSGAEVPFMRPAGLAGDRVADGPVFLHALEELERNGFLPDIVVNVRPTAPFRTGRHIDEALELLLGAPTADSVKSVCPVDAHPYKMWTIDDNGIAQPVRPDWQAKFGGDPDIARQRLQQVFRSNGAVDAARASHLRGRAMFHGGVVIPYVMSLKDSVDIDTERDLEAARVIGAA